MRPMRTLLPILLPTLTLALAPALPPTVTLPGLSGASRALVAQAAPRSPALDSLRAELNALNRAQMEEVRRIMEGRQGEFDAIREAMREAFDQNEARLQEARREVEEIRRQNTEIRREAEVVLQEALRERQRILREELGRAAPPVPGRPMAVPFDLPTVPFGDGPFLVGQRFVAGAELTPLNPALARYFGVESGVLVTSVTEGSPGATAGLQPGDVIVEVGGEAVRSVAELRQAIGRARPLRTTPGAALPADDTVLRVIREGNSVEVRLR